MIKSPGVPVSALSAVTVATALGPRGLQRVAVADARRGIAGRVNAAHRQRAGARRQRHPARRPCPAPAVASIQVVPLGAHLDLLARPQRAAVAAAHRLRRHAGDKVAGRAGVGTQRRHRRHRARRRGVDDDGLRVGGAAGIAGQVGDRDLEIVVGAGRQRGVERPVAGHHGCRAEQRAPLNTCTLAMPAPPVSATVPAKCTPPALVMKSLFEAPVSLVSVTVGNVSLGGVASTMMVCALAVVLALPARSVTVTLRLL